VSPTDHPARRRRIRAMSAAVRLSITPGCSPIASRANRGFSYVNQVDRSNGENILSRMPAAGVDSLTVRERRRSGRTCPVRGLMVNPGGSLTPRRFVLAFNAISPN
jgi:hypothetical protein